MNLIIIAKRETPHDLTYGHKHRIDSCFGGDFKNAPLEENLQIGNSSTGSKEHRALQHEYVSWLRLKAHEQAYYLSLHKGYPHVWRCDVCDKISTACLCFTRTKKHYCLNCYPGYSKIKVIGE